MEAVTKMEEKGSAGTESGLTAPLPQGSAYNRGTPGDVARLAMPQGEEGWEKPCLTSSGTPRKPKRLEEAQWS